MSEVKSYETWHESPNVNGGVVLYILRIPGEKKRRRPYDGVMWYKERVYSSDSKTLTERVLALSAGKDLLALDELLLQGKPFMEALELCPDT